MAQSVWSHFIDFIFQQKMSYSAILKNKVLVREYASLTLSHNKLYLSCSTVPHSFKEHINFDNKLKTHLKQ